MALLASSAQLPGLKFQFRHQPHHLSGCLLHRSNHPTLQISCTSRLMAQFGEPDWVKDQLNSAKERLSRTILEPVKMFPWGKVTDKMQDRSLSSGQKALKWSLIALFALSSSSDAIYSVFQNQELMIPFGLFVGCLLADFLREISEEAFCSIKENGSNWQLLAVGCVFLFFKFIAVNLALHMRVFLLHVGNGGLMQIFWLWRNLIKVNGTEGNETSSAVGGEK